MEKGKLMFRVLIGLLVILGLSAGAFFLASPELAKKTFDENKANAEKLVDDLKNKF